MKFLILKGGDSGFSLYVKGDEGIFDAIAAGAVLFHEFSISDRENPAECGMVYYNGYINAYTRFNRETSRPKKGRNRTITELERWTGSEWIADDGEPGIAFSGCEVDLDDRYRIKMGFHMTPKGDDTLKRLAAERSISKYGKSYGKIF